MYSECQGTQCWELICVCPPGPTATVTDLFWVLLPPPSQHWSQSAHHDCPVHLKADQIFSAGRYQHGSLPMVLCCSSEELGPWSKKA